MKLVDMESDVRAAIKLLTKIADDHEKRIRWLERGGAMCLGAALFIKFLIH